MYQKITVITAWIKVKFSYKAKEVNDNLKELCLSKNISLMEHHNFHARYHLNNSKLHPNRKDSGILALNFLKFFKHKWLVKCNIYNSFSTNCESTNNAKNDRVNLCLDDCISSVNKSTQLAENLEQNSQTSVFRNLKNIKQKNANRVTIAQINVNSIRNKFDFLCEMIRGNIDILLITETKIDSSFSSAQFQIDGYTTPFRFDRDSNGG